MGWKKWELALPDLSSGDDLAKIIDKIKEFLDVIVGVLETILNFIVGITDPIAAAIKELIEKIKETIEGFLEDVGIYVLHVPIGKRLMTQFLNLGDITPSWAGDLGIFGEGVSDADNPGDLGQIKSPWSDPELNDFLVQSNRYSGGNYGYFKTVIDSLWDQGDVNRPQFNNEDDYVGGVMMLMGTGFDPLGFLDDIWKLFGMFDLGVDGTPKAPRPTNLRGHAMTGIVKSSPNATGGKFSTFLQWDVPEVPLTSLRDLGGVILFPERYAIIRIKNNVNALAANSVPDLMGSRSLAQGDTFGSAEVIFEDAYDIMDVTYIDKDIEANPDDSFYYTIAWKLKGYNKGESDEKEYGYWYTSNVVRITPYPTAPASTPPDWYRTPSISSLFPQFAYFLRLLVAELEKLAARITGVADLIKEYVDFLKSEIAKYEALVNKILDAIKALSVKFEFPKTGIYYRTFKGKGGNTFFIQDLGMSLRKGYENAPPFFKGDEYVTGVILLTGGPEVLVDTMMTLMGWLFGSASDELTPFLENLDGPVAELEDKYFGDLPSDEVNFCDPPKPAPTFVFGNDMSVTRE
jgi:hypothetical protein